MNLHFFIFIYVVMKPYNRIEAVRYAQRWALGSNPKFYHFGGIGGDCTNFISQCFLAGGGEMIYQEDGWYYISQDNRSPSWTSVEALSNFLLRSEGVGITATQRAIDKLEVGGYYSTSPEPTSFQSFAHHLKKISSKNLRLRAFKRLFR